MVSFFNEKESKKWRFIAVILNDKWYLKQLSFL